MNLIILGAVASGLYLAMRSDGLGPDSDVPRGIRNNNPGNIELGRDQWQGMSESQTDGRFIQFVNPVWGIRAMARTLKTYRERYGINTPWQIINRWAPSTENNTEAYARAVADAAGLGLYQSITEDKMPAIIAAMIKHENGVQPYPADLIAEGIARAAA